MRKREFDMVIRDKNYDDLTERLLVIKNICDAQTCCTYDCPFCIDDENGCAVFTAFNSTPNTWEVVEE